MAFYKLTLNDEQAGVVERACDFYARVLSGNFNEIAWETMLHRIKDDDFCEARDAMQLLLLKARKFAFPELQGFGCCYGVGYSKTTDIAWNVYQVIRNAIAWHKCPDGGVTVDFDEPMDYGGVGMPKIEVANE